MTVLSPGDLIRHRATPARVHDVGLAAVVAVNVDVCTLVPLLAAPVAGQGNATESLTATPQDAVPVRGQAGATDAGTGWLADPDRPATVSLVGVTAIGQLDLPSLDALLRALARRFAGVHSDRFIPAPGAFSAGSTPIPPSAKVIGRPEVANIIDAAMDGWLTTGRFNARFEQRLGEFLGVEHVMTVNSGSSANLVALATLTSPRLGDRAIRPGDEVITVAAGFPTTVNPILQLGAVPVFVDVDIPTYNIDVSLLDAALTSRTRAVMLAHTLGNPFDAQRVAAFAKRHGLWLIEDCCDALGSTLDGRQVGSFGDIATLSFYPAHHITMGEGGAVFTRDPMLRAIAESFRDWGRDCHCPPGRDNSCGRRFCWQLGALPYGYDHKYIYTHLGFNLKITDMQAACALAQMDRLPSFIATRRRHFSWLAEALAPLAEQLELPRATPGSNPAWFGFPLTLREAAATRRVDLLDYLDQHRIGTRLLFAGNLTRQPSMAGRNWRVSGDLTRTDRILEDTFWIGVHPGLSEPMLAFMVSRLKAYFGLDS